MSTARIASSPWTGPAAVPAEPAAEPGAEERLEQVGDRAEALEVRAHPAAAQPLVAVAVEGLATLGVREDLVGLGGLLELLLGLRVVRVDVRVQLAREAAEGLLDRGLVGVAGDAEDLVRIARNGAGHESAEASALLVFVDVFDVARELDGGLADRRDRGSVVHPHRPDHRHGAELARRQAVAGGDDGRASAARAARSRCRCARARRARRAPARSTPSSVTRRSSAVSSSLIWARSCSRSVPSSRAAPST